MRISSISRPVRLASVALVIAATATGCGTWSETTSGTGSSSAASGAASSSAVAPETLLMKQSTTILGQPLVYPTQLPVQVSSSIITLLPGQSTGKHRHDAPLYVYVISGAVTVTYDSGEVNTYSAGESIMEAVGTVHNGANLGEVPVRILVTSFGAEGVANTVKLP